MVTDSIGYFFFTLVTDITVDFVTVVSIVPWFLWLREWQCVSLCAHFLFVFR
jgi:hypothetical protein